MKFRGGPRAVRWVALVVAASGAGACTTLLGGFDFEGSGGAASTAAGGSGGAASSSASSSSSSASSSGAATCDGGAFTCTQPTDCPIPASECLIRTCAEGCCGEENAAAKTPAPSAEKPGDCHRAECDGHGQIVQTIDDTDTDDGEQCTDDVCMNGKFAHTPVEFGACNENGGKFCGEPSSPYAGTCIECFAYPDCGVGEDCIGAKCVSPACTDQLLDGAETDVDCGGPFCAKCGEGDHCSAGTDCKSGVCSFGGTCASSCVNNVLDAAEGETDVDCGGPVCPSCLLGEKCGADSDCSTGKCAGGTCAPTCFDGQHDGGETDVDCGGPCAKKCDFFKACNTGADCASGFCNPNTGSCDAEILAQNQAFPQAVAVDATNVYWISYNAGVVSKLPLGTNTPIVIASGESPDGLGIDAAWPQSAGYVYWTNALGSVKRRRVDLGAATQVISTAENLPGNGIAVSSTHVYWANDGDGRVRRAPVGSTSPQDIATIAQSFDQHLAIDGNFVYWTHPKSMTVNKVPLTGGAPQMIATGAKPVGIAVDLVAVYWTDAVGGTVNKMPLGGGSVVTLASGLNSPWGIVVDTNNAYVYEQTNNARILQIPLGGGAMKVLAPGNGPGGIAVDNMWVYFTPGDHTVRRVLKQ